MDREKLEGEHFQIAIIGGGIVGSGLFRDQALHGLKSVIIEQSDFNSQTSAGSSKMLHGGIRYLENFDFALVFEALKEKNLWLKNAPHATKEIPFFLPVYKHSKWPLFFVRIGLFLYDLLSLFRNSPHKSFNREETATRLWGIKTQGLKGSGMYYDGIVDDHKLGLDCIYDALNNKTCTALNYTKLIRYRKKDGIFHLELMDTLTNSKTHITADHIQFATGPFTDIAMKELGIPWSPIILPSKGTHLWLKKDALKIDQAMVLQTKDSRVIFVIPQRGAILVGTTEIPLAEHEPILDIKPSPQEIEYLLEVLNEYFPKENLGHEAILSSFCAVRPLVKTGESSEKVSRNHKIYKIENNVYVIAGGKYTTFRKMAEDLNKKSFKDLGLKYNKELSKSKFKTTSIIKNAIEDDIDSESLEKILHKEMVRTREDLIKRRLSLTSYDNLDEAEKVAIDKIKI